MECGLISAPQSAFCCIRGLYNDTMLALLLALRVGAMCGTTIMASIGLSFLFLQAFPTSSNVTTAYHSASATLSSRLAPPNKKSPPESSRNTTTPRSILCTRFSFDPALPRAREHGGGEQVGAGISARQHWRYTHSPPKSSKNIRCLTRRVGARSLAHFLQFTTFYSKTATFKPKTAISIYLIFSVLY